MASRPTRTKSRPKGGRRRRGSLGLLRPRDGTIGSERQGEQLRPEPRIDGDRFDERRWREAGGPEDNELHTCGCGFAWEAPVSASVSCPHCGAAQAW